MIAIAESGSTKCDWVFLNNEGAEQVRFKTIGYNPYFHSSVFVADSLSESKDLIDIANDVSHVFFYGAGCSSEELQAQIASGLEQVFANAQIIVDHDLMAAAYSLYDGEPLISCIIGTGSNSCFYDGEKIHETLPALGFILGDEASGCHIGKQFITDYLYKKLPNDIHEDFESRYNLSWSDVRKEVYNAVHANVYLASYMPFIYEWRESGYVRHLVAESIRSFISIHIASYPNHRDVPIAFVGSVAFLFQDIVKQELEIHGCRIGRIIRGPIDSLVGYHKSKNRPLSAVS
jgi:glucosamine kinase